MKKIYKHIFCLIFLFLHSGAKLQEQPKNIIVIDEELEDLTEEKEGNKSDLIKEELNDSNFDENFSDSIVIDDIPKESNEWYGTTSSDEGGLGWLMWGSTSFEYSIYLLSKMKIDNKSITLSKLLSNLLTSRAKTPKYEKTIENSDDFIEKSKTIYLQEKFRIFSTLGMTTEIEKLLKIIPLEKRKSGLLKILENIRISNNDIPFLCSDLQKLFKIDKKNIYNRKVLVSCKIAQGKTNEASLALNLFENDFQNEENFLNIARNFNENYLEPYLNNSETIEIDELYLKILSLKDYQIARSVFSSNEKMLDKAIYDMKLFEPGIQLEALERLVEIGLHDSKQLKAAYLAIPRIDETTFLSKNSDIINSGVYRATLFKKIVEASSEINKAKYANILWENSIQNGLSNALKFLLVDVVNSLIPNKKIGWFSNSASKILLSTNNVEDAKQWLFFKSEDPKNRADLDSKFCKYLLMYYLLDKDAFLNNPNLPNIEYLLEILTNDLETDQKDLFKLVVSLKSIGYEIDLQNFQPLLQTFEISNQNDIKIFNNNVLFSLENAVNKKNLAETALISIYVLNQNSTYSENLYSYSKGLEALYKIGLDDYARNFAFESNAKILN